ncbi:MAG: D-alanyl-D-alanine carboxypeptidase family protein [Candidatus Omnitrophota bacterium]|jgi:LAS superfamily LD-carboxypeptidase LdcB
MIRRGLAPFTFFVFFGWLALLPTPAVCAKPDSEKLSEEDIAVVDSLLSKKAALIKLKEADGTLPLLSFAELNEGLDKKEKKFLKEIQKFKPRDLGVKTPFQGLSPDKPQLAKIQGQFYEKEGSRIVIAPQYVSDKVQKDYERMMRHMDRDIGKKLLIESGFRSSAYQLYSFVFYLRQHQYSLRETASLNALPGYSEHGNPRHQAVDFVNQEGVNGDGNPEAFTRLPEYQWLRKKAFAYGFFLSYPPNNSLGLSFEPWHWKYEGPPADR